MSNFDGEQINTTQTNDAVAGNGHEITVNDICEVLSGRASTYQLLSRLFFLPLKQDEVEQIADSGLDSSAFEEGLCKSGVEDMMAYFKRLNAGTRQELAVDFTSSFGGAHTYEERQALPYRSLFMEGSDRLLFAQGHTQAYETYKSACLKRREGLDYPDDHFSFMCDFMKIMSSRSVEALKDGNPEEAKENLKSSQAFLREQMLSWFDDFSDLASHIVETRFYRGVLKFTKGYLEFDDMVLSDLIEVI